MGQAEILIAGLLVAVAGLGALARYLSVPYPIVLVIGGALFGFVPGVPDVKLDPEVVLVVFLPPLLYGASIFANFNDLRANLRPLTLIAVGWIAAEIRKRTTDAQVSITISLLTGYAAFVPADAIGASGVLATVTAGIYNGIPGPRVPPPPLPPSAGFFSPLVGRGLPLPALIRRLGVSDGDAEANEELRARLVATKAAIDQ